MSRHRIDLYVGCYTNDSSTGIHLFDATDPDGAVVALSRVDDVEHPSFLAVHPGGGVLYAASETAAPHGSLVAFRIDEADGSLTAFDTVSSHGAAPCYVSVDSAGRHCYVANYGSGNVAAYGLSADGGFDELIAVHQHHGSGPHPRQDGPHAHCVLPDPEGSGVHAADLGTDRIVRYEHRPDGTFEPESEVALAPGSGPRHLAFHPREPIAFAVGELDSTVVTLAVDPANGRLRPLHVDATLPPTDRGDSIAAEVRVHPSGRFVYVSNRGHDSIAIFGFTDPGRPLEPLGHVHSGGRTPRNFAVHPSGRSLLVANQGSGTLVAFGIDEATGSLRQADVVAELSEPVCVAFAEVGR